MIACVAYCIVALQTGQARIDEKHGTLSWCRQMATKSLAPHLTLCAGGNPGIPCLATEKRKDSGHATA